MIVQHNLSLFDIPNFPDGGNAALVYSNDGSSRKFVAEELNKFRKKYILIFKATGFPDNILRIKSSVIGKEINYFPGDSKKYL